MRAHQFINEIDRIKDITPGNIIDINKSDSRDDIVNNTKKLPGNNPWRYSIIQGLGSYNIYMVDPTHSEIIGKLNLEEIQFPLKRAVRSNYITVHGDYGRYGIAKSLYGITLSILKRPLVSGTMQTPGGRRAWISLNNIPGVNVKGYISINDQVFDSDDLDVEHYQNAIMSTGAQYFGQDRSDHHYFSFDVRTNDGTGELEAVYNKFMKLYDVDDDYITTGLYAVWSAK
jgi:hypothetical protein